MLPVRVSDTDADPNVRFLFLKYLKYADMDLKLDSGAGIRYVTLKQVKLCVILYIFYIF